MNFMEVALKEAEKAYEKGEVPIGAVIVKNGKILSKAHNRVESDRTNIHHAEILAIKEAQRKISDWRLNECVIYTTVEPCIMCCGAIVLSRIEKVIFALKEPKFGAVVSNLRAFDIEFNHKVEYEIDTTYSEKVKNLMKKFFQRLRG